MLTFQFGVSCQNGHPVAIQIITQGRLLNTLLLLGSVLAFGSILSGAIMTEIVFAWPSLGFWLHQTVELKDYPVMQAVLYIISLTVIATDFSYVLYGNIDPRIRYD